MDPALGTPTPSCLQGEKAGIALDATEAAGCAWRPSRLRFPQFSAGHFPPHPGGLPGGQGWVRLSQPACSSLTPSHHGVYCPVPHTPPLLTPACLQPFKLPQHNRSLYYLPPPYPRPAPRPAGFASLWQVPPNHPQGSLLSPWPLCSLILPKPLPRSWSLALLASAQTPNARLDSQADPDLNPPAALGPQVKRKMWQTNSQEGWVYTHTHTHTHTHTYF